MRVIDSHTEGEPTRVIVDGGPDLGRGSMAERRRIFAERFDRVRSFAVNEPRGSDAVVGALLCEPIDPASAAGVIFFNNVGVIGMCGHGTIGLAVTLVHMGRIGPGKHCFETPVGDVTVDILGRNEVEIENVPSFRFRKDVMVDVPGLGAVTGDIAWGGNWFFLVSNAPHALTMAEIPSLTRTAQAVMDALETAGIRGEDGGKIDHVEFFSRPTDPTADSRNFVLCPGGAYDRSPCGTGTSAKLACLAADGKLAAGKEWVQESIVGSRFQAQYRPGDHGRIVPRIRGRAYVVAEATLLRDSGDPFADGMRGAP
ncbi:MAG: proline racemase family protein [Rhodospirillales bacterium]|nr:proline racemase family protein [Rhodospirillales bacterium]